MKYIVGVGGANMDIIIRSLKEPKLNDSNPSIIKNASGGVMRNILENLARLGEKTILLSSVGLDSFGEIIVKQSSSIGINMNHIYFDKEHRTSVYTAFIDDSGEMLIGGSDMELLNFVPLSYFEEKKELIKNASLIVIDTNFNTEQIGKVIEIAGDVPIYADPVSTAKASRLIPFLPHIHTIKPNIYELSLLSGIPCQTNEEIIQATTNLIEKGVKEVIVSLGSKGIYYQNDQNVAFFKALKPCKMVNATGAGDSFLASFIKARINNLPVEECIMYGLAGGKVAVESEETISPKMNEEEILLTIKNNL